MGNEFSLASNYYTFESDIDKESGKIERLPAIVSKTDVPEAGTEPANWKHTMTKKTTRVFINSDSQAGEIRKRQLFQIPQ